MFSLKLYPKNISTDESSSSNHLIKVLLVLWLVTLPFGAKVGALSLGFLSIYPNFILTIILTGVLAKSVLKWNKISLLIIAFFGLWLLVALFWGFLNERNANWKFDIRSLFMQFLYVFICIASFYELKRPTFLEIFRKGTGFILIVILLFGIFEYLTGIHFQGTFTDKLYNIPEVTALFYAPSFVYDNPNDYVQHYLLISILFIVLNRASVFNNWIALLLGIIGFFFADISGGRIGSVIAGMIILTSVLVIFIDLFKRKANFNLGVIILGFVFTALLFLNNKVDLGPKYLGEPWDLQERFADRFVEDTTAAPDYLNSSKVRMNLMLNGFQFVKESPILGIGPGQFRERHANKMVLHPTDTVIGPHNYPLELISQYGVFGWGVLFMLFSLFILLVKNFMKEKGGLWFVLLLPVFGLASIISSGFLYLDINHLFIGLVFTLVLTVPKLKSA